VTRNKGENRVAQQKTGFWRKKRGPWIRQATVKDGNRGSSKLVHLRRGRGLELAGGTFTWQASNGQKNQRKGGPQRGLKPCSNAQERWKGGDAGSVYKEKEIMARENSPEKKTNMPCISGFALGGGEKGLKRGGRGGKKRISPGKDGGPERSQVKKEPSQQIVPAGEKQNRVTNSLGGKKAAPCTRSNKPRGRVGGTTKLQRRLGTSDPGNHHCSAEVEGGE